MDATFSRTSIDKNNVQINAQEAFDERKKAEKKLVRKIDLLLLPPLMTMYLLNYLDRQNITSARLANIEADLNLSTTQYQTVVSILFVGYILMGVPSNLFLAKVSRPAWYMTGVMCVWGFLSAMTGLVNGFGGLLAIRFILGIIEAAFFPGALFYLSCWYTHRELASRTAILYMGSQMGNAWGGLLAAAILQLDGVHGIEGWRWLFIVEGVATAGCAIAFAFILPDFPSTARRFFTDEDKILAQLRLEEDSRQADIDNNDDGDKTTRWQGFLLTITDIKVWLVIAVLYLDFIAAAVVQFFPSVVNTLGFSRNITLVCTAPPYLLCCVWLLVNGFHADKKKEHYWHVVVPLFFLTISNIIAVSTMNTGARYFAMMLMPGGAYSAAIVILAWLSHIASRPAVKRASALAFCNSVVNTPNVWCSYLYFNPPRYVVPFVINTIASGLAIVMATLLRMYLARQNKYIEKGEYEKLGRSGPTKTQLEQGFKYML